MRAFRRRKSASQRTAGPTVNIIAGKEVVPELLQHDVNGERIAAETRKLLEPEYNRWVRDELAAVRTKLGEPGASRRAAEAIVSAVRR